MSGLFEELEARLHEEKGTAMATVVRGEEQVGAKMLVYPDKTARGSLGHAALDALVIQDAERSIWTGESHTRTYSVETSTGAQSFDVFIEGFPPPPQLIIIGAGHIAIPLTT